MQTITVTVSPGGKTKIEPKGFSGSACLEATRRLEQLLGGTLERKETAEMHATEVSSSIETTNG